MHPFIPGEILTDPYSLPKMMQQSTQNDDQQQPLEVKRKASVAVPMKYSHLDKQEVGISLYGIMSFAHNASFEAHNYTENANYVLLWYIYRKKK